MSVQPLGFQASLIDTSRVGIILDALKGLFWVCPIVAVLSDSFKFGESKGVTLKTNFVGDLIRKDFHKESTWIMSFMQFSSMS